MGTQPGYDLPSPLITLHPAWVLEGWLPLAVLAVKTERIPLGSHVNCIFYRHPELLARLAADLDHISSGRLIQGLRCGWDANEFANFGMPFPPARERQAALEEAITIIQGLWAAEPFTFHGRYFHTTEAQVTPPPLQCPGLPFMIAGSGERVTLCQVARYTDACRLGSIGMISGTPTAEGLHRKLTVLRLAGAVSPSRVRRNDPSAITRNSSMRASSTSWFRRWMLPTKKPFGCWQSSVIAPVAIVFLPHPA